MQAYPLPDGIEVDPAGPLPPPNGAVETLEPTIFSIPFSFKLPNLLPPSIETPKQAFVRYSIYSQIELDRRRNPSTRKIFTVMTRNPLEYRYPSVPQPFHDGVSAHYAESRCWSFFSKSQPSSTMSVQVRSAVSTIEHYGAP